MSAPPPPPPPPSPFGSRGASRCSRSATARRLILAMSEPTYFPSAWRIGTASPIAPVHHQQRVAVRAAIAYRVEVLAQPAEGLAAPAPLDPGQVLGHRIGGGRHAQVAQPIAEPLIDLPRRLGAGGPQLLRDLVADRPPVLAGR